MALSRPPHGGIHATQSQHTASPPPGRGPGRGLAAPGRGPGRGGRRAHQPIAADRSFTISGQTILYNVPLTIASMAVSVVVVAIGLFIVGFSRTEGALLVVTGGVIIGLGVASVHYLGVDAMSIRELIRYNIPLVVLSVLIAIAAGIAALWAGLKARSIWSTLTAALIFGVAVTGMHYTGMAAMHVYAASGGVYGIVIMLAPSEEEIRADARLAERLAERPVSHRR